MREIKFRGKSHDNEGKIEGEWIYGYLIAPDQIMVWDEDKSVGQAFQVYPETVGQFTGLQDKNGKEIWEGDIVKWERDDLENMGDSIVHSAGKGEIVWISEVAMFGFKQPHRYGHIMMEDSVFEVIGNIHDNPELIQNVSRTE